ncbi:hypothetical protein [Sulfurovum riftiae]|nr:hypothetical protein [Sulfurovum riftiae]
MKSEELMYALQSSAFVKTEALQSNANRHSSLFTFHSSLKPQEVFHAAA